MIAEIHQEDIAMLPTIIIPNTPEAERMALMMNANLPAFLWYMFIKGGAKEKYCEDTTHKVLQSNTGGRDVQV
jgi:hypothetical protein